MNDILTPFDDHPPGARDAHGHFEPFLIPRALMPQINEADYPELFAWLEAQSVGVEQDIFHPDELRLHQRMDRHSLRAMPLAIEREPILVSRDLYVIDGNHREERHKEDGRMLSAFVIDRDFAEAVMLVRAFPRAYEIADDSDIPGRVR